MGVVAALNKSHFFPEGMPTEKRVKARFKLHSSGRWDWFWGLSPAMTRLRCEVDALKNTQHDLNVLIVGETGTGKECISQILHEKRKAELSVDESAAPFVALNSGAIPESLAESILFGHERGAFTSARERQYGKFEMARRGTLFLDEIQNLSLGTQAKLLRVLQSKQFDRLGAKKSQPIECQVIAASNVPLELLVEKQSFRKDLYYRLNICPLYLPALRHRKEDLPALIRGLLAKLSDSHSLRSLDVSSDAFDILLAYDWPGNIRELEYALLYAGMRAKDIIRPEDLPASLTGELAQYLRDGAWMI